MVDLGWSPIVDPQRERSGYLLSRGVKDAVFEEASC